MKNFLFAILGSLLASLQFQHARAQAIPDTTYNQLVRLPPGEWGIQAMDGTFSVPLACRKGSDGVQ